MSKRDFNARPLTDDEIEMLESIKRRPIYDYTTTEENAALEAATGMKFGVHSHEESRPLTDDEIAHVAELWAHVERVERRMTFSQGETKKKLRDRRNTLREDVVTYLGTNGRWHREVPLPDGRNLVLKPVGFPAQRFNGEHAKGVRFIPTVEARRK